MTKKASWLKPEYIWKVFGIAFFVYLFFGFMLLPCLNTITQIFTVKGADGQTDPLAVIRFFFAGNMPSYVWNSLKLAICLVITVNIVGVSIVLLTEYFDIKGAKVLRLGYMTTLIYSGVALVTGYLFLYDSNGMLTSWLVKVIPGFNKEWFSGFRAVLFTMTFACTSNHMLFLRNAIRSIDYNTVEAARNLGAKPFKVLLKVVFPTLIPTLFSLTVMTFITGLCAMSAPTLLGYDSINPEIVRLAGSSVADEAFPQARAALLSIILAMFTIILLTTLSSYERKGHYLSVSKTKAKLVKQKIQNPVVNVLAHIYAYVLFLIYMTPVVMIVLFAFQNYPAIRAKSLDMNQWTLINFFGQQDYEFLTNRGKLKTRVGSISGLFANADTVGGIRLSFVLSAIAAALACVIVVVAVNYIFKNKNKKRATVLEYSLLFPWLLPTILICYSYRTYFNSENVWYVFNTNLYWKENVRFLIVMAYTVVKLPFALRMIKAAFYAIDEELEDAARNLGASPLVTFLKVKLPIVLPSVLAVFALNFNALFTEYDMSATFHSSYGKSYAMVIQNMCAEEGRDGYNVNASGRRCASTVFIMIVSGLILYLVYGVGARDLGERLAIREKRRKRWQKLSRGSTPAPRTARRGRAGA
ncbi:MAG: iron ABC transporter permease [Clostridiales bacterium]|nr:iron ABC transporter permease [Clostridiales bacterium]